MLQVFSGPSSLGGLPDWTVELLFWEHDLSVDEEQFMWLLFMVVIECKDSDKPIDASTEAMKHSVALATCLWVMFEEQKQRVYFQGIWLLNQISLEIFPGWLLRVQSLCLRQEVNSCGDHAG